MITCVISLILFWFNVALVRSLFDLIRPSLANATHERRIEQAAVLIGPAALLLLQWWLWEVAMEWLWPDQDDEPGSVRY